LPNLPLLTMSKTLNSRSFTINCMRLKENFRKILGQSSRGVSRSERSCRSNDSVIVKSETG
jgi:hypothetical protein